MVMLTSAVANGGIRYKPLILKSINTADGAAVLNQKPEILGKLPVSRENLELVKKGLWEVVNNKKGTAWVARMDEIEISGKTGTAQVISRKKNDTSKNKETAAHLMAHAWFVAYAPAIDPRIAVSVIVEHGEHGSSTAAPIAKELISTYLSKDGKSKLTASKQQ
jgi:penicillin-binding protein 2